MSYSRYDYHPDKCFVKKKVLKKILDIIRRVREVRDHQSKVGICEELFNYIVVNSWIVYVSPPLEECIWKKLHDWYAEGYPLRLLECVVKELFPDRNFPTITSDHHDEIDDNPTDGI